MKNSKSKCKRKTPKIHLVLIQSKIPFWWTKSVALRYYFQIFTKSYQVVFWKSSLYFTSPMKISRSNCNSKTPLKIYLILIQSKINFECTKSLALGCYSQDFTKNYRVVFQKSSLYFTSHMKISKSKSNNKTTRNPFNFDSIKNSFWVHIDTSIRMLFTKFYTKLSSSFWKMLTLLHLPSPLWNPQNPFNFDSIKNSFWVQIDTGIRMLFTKFYKKLSSRFWKMLTLLHLPSPLWKFLSSTKCNRKPPQNPFNFDSIKNPFWLHVVNGI